MVVLGGGGTSKYPGPQVLWGLGLGVWSHFSKSLFSKVAVSQKQFPQNLFSLPALIFVQNRSSITVDEIIKVDESSTRRHIFATPFRPRPPGLSGRELFIDNLLVRMNFIIEMIWWTGLVPWEF